MHHAVVLVRGSPYDLGGHWNRGGSGGEVPVRALDQGKQINRPWRTSFEKIVTIRV